MADSLNVVALISGGKDSFFSILHCLQNGHKIVALGNLHPVTTPQHASQRQLSPNIPEDTLSDEKDLNSWMYQTVGHTVIPLYAEALGLPLYRQAITGTAVNSSLTYHAPSSPMAGQDETEDLLTLLSTIMIAHSEVNAVSTGAILSTYQRTRVESIALRLGLTPLSYLWQYPNLPPHIPSSLLQDMQAIGIDARIIKVASGGLDEGFLWENVASVRGMTRIERAVGRFGSLGDGAVLGEGGEFETLVLDGPSSLFKGKVVIAEEDMAVNREGGGSAWLSFKRARIEMKHDLNFPHGAPVRTPPLLDRRFFAVYEAVRSSNVESEVLSLENLTIQGTPEDSQFRSFMPVIQSHSRGLDWTFTAHRKQTSIEVEAQDIITQIFSALSSQGLKSTDIIFTTIILRNMSDFATINQIYSCLFQDPNPPSRATISCGSALHTDHNIIIHLKLRPATFSAPQSKVLHVQSRSYWAPANIGPYSQAQALPFYNQPEVSTVFIAGQIPLVPASMAFPTSKDLQALATPPTSDKEIKTSLFELETVLGLQHLHRIAVEMNVSYFPGAVAYIPQTSQIPTSQRLKTISKAWQKIYRQPVPTTSSNSDLDEDMEDIDSSRDLWDERHHGSLIQHSKSTSSNLRPDLPDWSRVTLRDIEAPYTPPVFIAAVSSLPRDASIEWQSLFSLTASDIEVTSSTSIAGSIGDSNSIAPALSSHSCHVLNSTGYVVKIEIVAITAQSVSGSRVVYSHLRDAESTGRLKGLKIVAAWIDVGDPWNWGYLDGSMGVAAVPCFKIWDGQGQHIAAVLVYRN